MRMADTEYEITEKLVRKFILLGKNSDEEIASCSGLSKEQIEVIRRELEEEGKLPKK